MLEPLRPSRGGFLRPFGCGRFVREFLLGHGPNDSPKIDSDVGAAQANVFFHYKTALLKAIAIDRATKREEKQARHEKRAQEFVRMVYSIEEVQNKTGLSLEDLDNKVHDLERKAADLEPISKQHEDYAKEVAQLTTQRDNLATVVAGLEQKYKLLNPRVKYLEKRDDDLSHRIKDVEAKADKAEATLATGSPDQGLTLEALVKSRQLELEEQKQAVALARQERESLRAAIDSLKQEKTSLEASIKNTREKVGREIAKIIPVATDAINRLLEEVRRGHNEALVEVRRLMDKAAELGKEVGQYEEIVQANQWLTELVALVRGEESVDTKRVRVLVLSVLRGAAAWLKHNGANKCYTLPYLIWYLHNTIALPTKPY